MNLRRLASGLAVAGITGFAALFVTHPVGAQTGPNAENDVASVAEDSSVTIDVLVNDEPSTGLTLQSVTDPPNGSAIIESGEVIYTPDENFNGDDTFAYIVTDGDVTVGAAVSVTVTPVNDAPEASDDSATTEVDTAVEIDVLDNDDDVDGDDLTVEIQDEPENGTVSVDDVTQEVTYTPDAGFAGTDSFTYVASDGTETSDEVTVTVEVKEDSSGPSAGLDPRVLAACEEHAENANLHGLCSVYQNEDIPVWARARIGHVILKLVAYRVPDAILEACESTESEYVEWLCEIYESGHLPPGLQKQLGRQIVALADTDIDFHRSDEDDKDKDDERGDRGRDKDKNEGKDWKPGNPWWFDRGPGRDRGEDDRSEWRGWFSWQDHDDDDPERRTLDDRTDNDRGDKDRDDKDRDDKDRDDRGRGRGHRGR